MGTVHIDITLVASPETGVLGLRNPNGVVKNVDVLLSVFGAKKDFQEAQAPRYDLIGVAGDLLDLLSAVAPK